MRMKKPLVIVITGPTSTGKSDFGARLAKKIGGEVISADSRQVYRDLNLLSGKVTTREMMNVPHYLLDVANPKKVFTVSDFVRLGTKAIDNIVKRKKIPIIVGGTGFYIDALLGGNSLPEVPANPSLRKKLEKKSVVELFVMLQKKDPARARTIDPYNKVRLVRALEIVEAIGKVPKRKVKNKYEIINIYLDYPDEILKSRIKKRLYERIKKGMIREAKRLRASGVSWKRMKALGLECRHIAQYLQGKLSRTEMVFELEKEIWHYTKRQRTWFKKYPG